MNFACKEVETHLADFVAEQGDAKTRGRVKAHLDVCASCSRLAREQAAMRHQLRLLAARDRKLMPPAPLWERASTAWNIRDAQQTRRSRLRWALAGSSMMVFLLSAVWANLAPAQEFPIEAVLSNFRSAQAHAVIPSYRTDDPDKAARWLRDNLHAELPPVSLTLSHGELLGADVIAAPQQFVGRLLYRTPQGLAAVYLVPASTVFARTSELPIGNRTFHLRNSADVGMYGWESNTVGFGLLLSEPIGTGRNLAINAAHATEDKGE